MIDVIVIGGGPSGLMAAIAAAEQKKKVLLIEKGNKLGKKLAISGGGRCNVTNRLSVDEIIKHIPGMVDSYIVHLRFIIMKILSNFLKDWV